jgi:hypothetical protein
MQIFVRISKALLDSANARMVGLDGVTYALITELTTWIFEETHRGRFITTSYS